MAASNGGFPAPVATPVVALAFGRADLGPVRRLVRAVATQAGLVGTRLQSFVLAVNEITTNAVMHGGGHGRLRLWRTGRQVVCEISDTGPGLPAGHESPETAPPPEATHGRGLWLTRALCDHFSLQTSRYGTVVRLGASADGS